MSLSVQIEKYDAATVEAEIENLSREVDDEHNVASTLVEKDSSARLSAAREFISAHSETISRQHTNLHDMFAELKSSIDANVRLESADAEYSAFLQSEEAAALGKMLSEIQAMIASYRDLLISTGRAGRPPVFD